MTDPQRCVRDMSLDEHLFDRKTSLSEWIICHRPMSPSMLTSPGMPPPTFTLSHLWIYIFVCVCARAGVRLCEIVEWWLSIVVFDFYSWKNYVLNIINSKRKGQESTFDTMIVISFYLTRSYKNVSSIYSKWWQYKSLSSATIPQVRI